jgi:hypothetical protein
LNQKLLTAVLGPTFDSDKFLHRSPYTETGNEIGSANNASPAALAVLREAGLLKGNNELKRPSELDAPVRVEPSESDKEVRALEAAAPETRSSRRSRLATSDNEATVERSIPADEERPRRRRRRTTSEETSSQSRSRLAVSEKVSAPSAPSEAQESTQESSPVPVPESHDGSTLQVEEESPVPQPE